MTASDSMTRLEFLPVADGRQDVVAVVVIDRPSCANALDDRLIADLSRRWLEIAARPECRALVVAGRGKNFCAGADLAWMRRSAALDHAANVSEAKDLQKMFEGLARMPLPTIACVRGSAFGGGVGLAAACDIVLADAEARFCLSEARLGLVAAVISPYVGRRMRQAAFLRQALGARIFSGEEAARSGLVDIVVSAEVMASVLQDELTGLLRCSRDAQAEVKSLSQRLAQQGFPVCDYTVEAIARTRVSIDGQAGLKAFLDKSNPPWHVVPRADLAQCILAVAAVS